MNLKEIKIIGNVAVVKELTNSISYKIAVNESRKDENGNYTESVTWYNVLIPKKNPKTYNQGDALYITGDFTISTYGKDGEIRIETTIFPHNVQRLLKKKKTETNDLPEDL